MHKERKVFTIGETVLDIIFRDGIPLAAKPGGSMLNSAVSLGRCGIPVSLISEAGSDMPEKTVTDFLTKNGVDTRFVQKYEHGNTAIALAFLDSKGDASYSFYRSFPKERLTLELPPVSPDDIILFGSFFSITPEIRETVIRFLKSARSTGALLIYDPNFRPQHLTELDSTRPWIIENISLADIVRGSDEDFLHIFGVGNSIRAFEVVKDAGCSFLIYTKNKEDIHLHRNDTFLTLPVPSLKPVSTIGAGDAFNAGLIYTLMTEKLGRDELYTMQEMTLVQLAETGSLFAGDVCRSVDNYVSWNFVKMINQ